MLPNPQQSDLENVKVWETAWGESVQPGCPVLYV